MPGTKLFYLPLYGIVHSLLEFFRYAAERGRLLWLSTSQCGSLVIIRLA